MGFGIFFMAVMKNISFKISDVEEIVKVKFSFGGRGGKGENEEKGVLAGVRSAAS